MSMDVADARSAGLGVKKPSYEGMSKRGTLDSYDHSKSLHTHAIGNKSKSRGLKKGGSGKGSSGSMGNMGSMGSMGSMGGTVMDKKRGSSSEEGDEEETVDEELYVIPSSSSNPSRSTPSSPLITTHTEPIQPAYRKSLSLQTPGSLGGKGGIGGTGASLSYISLSPRDATAESRDKDLDDPGIV